MTFQCLRWACVRTAEVKSSEIDWRGRSESPALGINFSTGPGQPGWRAASCQRHPQQWARRVPWLEPPETVRSERAPCPHEPVPGTAERQSMARDAGQELGKKVMTPGWYLGHLKPKPGDQLNTPPPGTIGMPWTQCAGKGGGTASSFSCTDVQSPEESSEPAALPEGTMVGLNLRPACTTKALKWLLSNGRVQALPGACCYRALFTGCVFVWREHACAGVCA